MAEQAISRSSYQSLAELERSSQGNDVRARFIGALRAALDGQVSLERLRFLDPALFGEAAGSLPPIVDGGQVNLTPLRLLAILDAVESGRPAVSAGVLYMTQPEFTALATEYWQSTKNRGAFQLPQRYAFLLPVFRAAPQTDFLPFSVGATATLEECAARALPALGLVLQVAATDASHLNDREVAARLTRLGGAC